MILVSQKYYVMKVLPHMLARSCDISTEIKNHYDAIPSHKHKSGICLSQYNAPIDTNH